MGGLALIYGPKEPNYAHKVWSDWRKGGAKGEGRVTCRSSHGCTVPIALTARKARGNEVEMLYDPDEHLMTSAAGLLLYVMVLPKRVL